MPYLITKAVATLPAEYRTAQSATWLELAEASSTTWAHESWCEGAKTFEDTILQAYNTESNRDTTTSNP